MLLGSAWGFGVWGLGRLYEWVVFIRDVETIHKAVMYRMECDL